MYNVPIKIIYFVYLKHSLAYQMLKVAIVGDSSVGKSSLVSRFVKRNETPLVQHTIGVDVTITSLSVHNKLHRIKFFDLSGNYFYESLYDNYLLNAETIVVVYDVTRLKTFIKAKYYIKKIVNLHGIDYPIILVGNKIDEVARRRVNLNTALGYIKGNCNIYYIETSAINGVNTLDCLRMLICEASRNQQVFLNDKSEQNNYSKCYIQ